MTISSISLKTRAILPSMQAAEHRSLLQPLIPLQRAIHGTERLSGTQQERSTWFILMQTMTLSMSIQLMEASPGAHRRLSAQRRQALSISLLTPMTRCMHYGTLEDSGLSGQQSLREAHGH